MAITSNNCGTGQKMEKVITLFEELKVRDKTTYSKLEMIEAIKKTKQEEAKEWISDLKQTILNKHTIRLLKKKHNTK